LDTKNRYRRHYAYRGHYLSTIGRRSRRPRHARKGDTLLRTTVRTLTSWFRKQGERISAWSRRAVGAVRSASARVFSKRTLVRYSTHLSVAAGVAIVVLSVYLVRLGWLAPQPVFIGPTPDVSESGAFPGETAGAGGTGGAGGSAGASESNEADGVVETESPGGTAVNASSGAPDLPEASASGAGEGTIAPDGGPGGVQPVIDLEGQDQATVGPASLGECLQALVRPAHGEVVRGMGWNYSEVYEDWRYHSGVDVALAAGDPVRAALEGLVVEVSQTSAEGGRVVINHGFGLVTEYEHLGTILVTEGQIVDTGETIARAGPPGVIEAELGVHLHFGVKVNDEAVDPEDYVDF